MQAKKRFCHNDLIAQNGHCSIARSGHEPAAPKCSASPPVQALRSGGHDSSSTVAKDSYTSVVEVLLHQPQIGEAVLILRESFTPVYAPLCNVTGHVRQDTSISTRHAQGLYKKNRSVQAVPFSQAS